MLKPKIDQFKKKAKTGQLVPVMKELILDCETPVSAYLKLAGKEKNAFLLESVEYGEKIGRYSLLGFDPELVYEKVENRIYVWKNGKRIRNVAVCDMLSFLQQEMNSFNMKPIDNVPLVGGGFVGFFSYENVTTFEDIELQEKASLGFPEAVFFLTKKIVIFDHVEKKVKIVAYIDVSDDKDADYEKALDIISKVEKKLKSKLPPVDYSVPIESKVNLNSNFTKKEFEEAVRKVKKYIKEGDIIQAVLSQRFELGAVKNDFLLYRALRTVNPSPYMFHFKYGDMKLIGSSPEVLVKSDGINGELRPIAGTRKRGITEEDDGRLAADLKADKKELAEHLMLVDLGRNDLGRVCEFGSVNVTDYARVEKYSHVMHLVSEVHGKLKKRTDCFDLLRAAFPAGTLSGAPKIRAMEIINELEPDERGPYGGCLGHFGFNRGCNMCITIRTIMINNGQAYLQAGAGIVYDSDPAKEYEETVNKAKALVKTVQVAAEAFE